MNRWFNPSHPQTLQAAVFLGYLSALFGLLFVGRWQFMILVLIGLGAGAFGSANNRRWGYYLLSVAAILLAAASYLRLLGEVPTLVPSLFALNATVFPTALAVVALHPQSRQYQKIWFE